jgi:sterol desaturase/sphingolipid hydroxylase (fatty acid hydroxylase superfamily)
LHRLASPIAIVLAAFAIFFVVEKFVPLRKTTRVLVARLLVNLAISALAFAIASLTVRPAAALMLRWSAQKSFGLLHLFALPSAVEFALGFLLMDLAFYYWHVANHRVPFLWRFHNVHHTDPDLDVSTGFRFHFGEVAMSAAFRIAQVGVIGVSAWTFAAYEIVFQINTLFHHSNARLPLAFERLLNKILVTPRMHGIHHSQLRAETDSNYGVVFPWWDRLHRTLGLNIAQRAIVIGVPGYSRPEDNRLWNLLFMPFRRQRDYWRTAGSQLAHRKVSTLREKKTRMEE